MADYRAMARAAAEKYGVNPDIFDRQISQETGNYDPAVISGQRVSSAGAKGIAELMPSHWINVDPTDPAASLDYAAGLMADYLQQYNGDYAKARAGYNAGPGNVAKYDGVPPFEETQKYVATILGWGGNVSSNVPYGGGPMDPVTDSRIKALEDQIKQGEAAANQRDQDGDPTLAAIQAQKSLPDLYKQLLDWTKQSASEAKQATSGPTPDEIAKNKAYADYYDAQTRKIDAEAKTPEERAAALGLLQAQINYQIASAGNLGVSTAETTRHNLWTEQYDPWKLATQHSNDLELAKQQEQAVALENQKNREADALRSRMTNTTALSGQMQNAWQAALPYAVRGDIQQYPGFEPNGPYAQLLKLGGANYDPNQYRVPVQQFDPTSAWRQAQGLM